MAAGDSAIKVCSDALLLLGAKAISSFNEGTDSSNICDRLYPDLKRSTIESHNWTFAYKKVKLARTINTPVNEYKYEYQLPSDRVGLPRRVFDSTAVGAGIAFEWIIQGDKLLTNLETVVIDYKFMPTESEMPTYFIQLLKYLMAWHLADPITDQITKTQYWQQIAVGSPADNGRGGYMRTAMNIDGQGTTTSAFEDFSLIAVRN